MQLLPRSLNLLIHAWLHACAPSRVHSSILCAQEGSGECTHSFSYMQHVTCLCMRPANQLCTAYFCTMNTSPQSAHKHAHRSAIKHTAFTSLPGLPRHTSFCRSATASKAKPPPHKATPACFAKCKAFRNSSEL